MFKRIEASAACDKALIRIAGGDNEAISVIYEHCAKKIFFLARSITRSDADSEDVLQNTVLKIISSAKSYKPGTDAIAWIMTVARSCAISYIRSKHKDCPLDEALEAISDTENYAEYEALYYALNRLAPDERQIVIMKVQLSLKHKQIAQILGITIDASQKRYRRAVEKLNKYYYR